MTEEQIKHMVNRFLGWRVPDDWHPDAGITYTRPNYHPSVDARPSGTNLFDATQADAMVRYMLEGMPETIPAPAPWAKVPVDAQLLAEIFDGFAGSDAYNLVAQRAIERLSQTQQ